MGSSDGSKRSTSGREASSGNSSASRRSRTSSTAKSISVPQANSRTTSDWPARETERTSRRFLTMPSASSSPKET